MQETHKSSRGFDCSVVVRAHNEERYVGRLLDGVAQQTIKNLEVVLVDSGSSDRTIPVAVEYRNHFPVTISRIPPDEFTFGRSLNLGISYTKADRIVIASAHVYPVYPDWLEQLLAPLSNDSTALSYGKQRGARTTNFSEQQIFARWYPDHNQSPPNNPFCNNANAAVQRRLWEQHPYDETLSGLEDIAWADWAVDQGYHLAYVPEAEVIHVHNEKPRAVYNRYRREAMAFKRIYPNQSFSIWDLIRLLSTNIASDLWHAGRQKKLHDNLGSIFWFRWMQFWGTYQGYHQSGPLTWQLRQTFYYPQGVQRHSPAIERKIEPIRYND